jgi:AAA domain (Cdc48 subfamily)/C-terminal, D2-small domain, of ClpB protein
MAVADRTQTPSSEEPQQARWLNELERYLRAGRHVLLHGNVRDLVLQDGRFMDPAAAIDEVLRRAGYTLCVRYDLTDGLALATPQMKKRYQALLDGRTDAPSSGVPYGLNSRPAAGSPNDLRDQSASAPAEGLAAIRTVLRQCRDELACCVIDLADRLFPGGDMHDLDVRRMLATMSKAMAEAFWRDDRHELAGRRNSLIFVASHLGQVPSALYRDHPTLSLIHVPKPDERERMLFLSRRYAGFHGARAEGPSEAVRNTFKGMTEGFTFWELDALRLTSVHEGLSIEDCVRLIDRFRHGEQIDPWRDLDRARYFNGAREHLLRDVMGQDVAVQAVVDALSAARAGLSLDGSSGRPKAVLFLVGPTGVGKTEMARSLARLVYGDETALARYDMSEYREEHAALRLTGAPPSYIGHEAGGQLTNRLRQRPFSVLLFDEIEKAHHSVLDKFLQVMDDGRLTDGLGNTVSFSQSMVLFTSNIGAGSLSPASAQNRNYEDLRQHYLTEVRNYFQRIGRPELFGRIGENGVVVFDVLRPSAVEAVLDKFLRKLAEGLRREHGVGLDLGEEVRQQIYEHCLDPAHISLGGRAVKKVVESELVVAVSRIILPRPDDAEVVRLSLDPAGKVIAEWQARAPLRSVPGGVS